MHNYQLLNLPSLTSDVLITFHDLSKDNHMQNDDQYRSRAYSTGCISKNTIVWSQKPVHFKQSSMINKYSGDKKREFDGIVKENKQYLVNNIISPLLYPKLPEGEYNFGVHQIRITTSVEQIGHPAPEGIHQDGFDYIAVICMSTHNIAGGASFLVDALEHQKVLFERVIFPGEILLFNDKLYAHYVSPIVPKLPGEGYRDVFVITFEKAEE